MRRFALILSLTAAIWAASADSSRAEFRVCNSTSEDVRIAFGNNDSRFGWTSRGWWTLAPGACQGVLYGDVERGNYYVYAVDSSRRTLRIPETQPGGTFCTKDTAFDLRSNNFMTPQNTIACESHALKSMRFLAVEVSTAVADFTYNLPASTMPAVSSSPVPATNPAAPTIATTVAPIIKEVAQTLVRPAPPPVATPAPVPAPAPVAQAPAPHPQKPQASNTACQRYPNLC